MRAVDGVSLHIDRNEIYGLAGESSCGKTTLIKTIVRAIRPPLNVVGGSVTFNFAGRERDIYALSQAELDGIRWRHLSYILQGSMNVLNPVRRVRQSFVDFAYRHIGKPMPEFLRAGRRPSRPRAARARGARQLSARAVRRDAPARHDRARQRLPARLHRRGRADHRARRRGAEGRARHAARGAARNPLVDDPGHARHRRARQRHRPARHHVCGPAGGGGPHRRRDPQSAPSLHGASRLEPAAHRRRDAEARPRRRAAQSRRAAARLPLPSALSARDGHLPHRASADGRCRARPPRRLLGDGAARRRRWRHERAAARCRSCRHDLCGRRAAARAARCARSTT